MALEARSSRTSGRFVRVVVLAAVAASAVPGGNAWAQNIGQTTGQIAGVVLDTTGGVLPGVTVTVTSPALAGGKVVTTSAAGDFQVPGLPPGHYRVEAHLQGFASVVVEDIDLKVGQTIKPNIRLSPGVKETVDVVASPMLDVLSTAMSSNISAEAIDELPKGRSWDSIVSLAPAVNTETTQGARGISFRGASISENSYIIDGVDTTSVVTGDAGQDLALEFVNEVQVKSGFVGAEFGGALGGIVNVVTKSGSNAFRYTANLQYSGSRLTADPRQRLRVVPTNSTKAEYVRDAKDPVSQYDFGATAGGRLVRDNVWFFGGWMPQYVITDRTVKFVATGQSADFSNEVRRHFATGKITARAGRNLTLAGNATLSPNNSFGALPSHDGTGATNVDYAARGTRQKKFAYSLSGDWLASPGFFVNAFVGYHTKKGNDAGVPVGNRYRYVTSNFTVPGVPTSFQGPANFETSSDNVNTFANDDTRLSMGVTGTWSFTGAGRHLAKFGFQYARPTTSLDFRYTGERADVHWGSSFFGLRGAYGYWRAFDIWTTGKVVSNNQALFVQDSWTLKNLTLNVGLRAEREDLTPYTNKAGDSRRILFGFKDKLAPRVGVSWDVRGDSTWKAYVNAGAFYDLMKHSAARDGFGGGAFKISYYTLDTYDYNLLHKDTPIGTLIYTLDLRGTGDVLDPAIKPAKTMAYDAGTEFQLAQNVTASVGYVHRAVVNTVEDFYVALPNGTYQKTLGNPSVGMVTQPYGAAYPAQPKLERIYDGLDLQLHKRLSDGWTASASYTLSRLTGNYDGLADSDQQIYADINPNLGIYCDYLEGCFTSQGAVDAGRLPNDRPHQFKLNGVYNFKFGLSAGAFFQAYSGTPITSMLGVNSSTVTHPYGRGADGRNTFVTQSDLSLNYALKLFGRSKAQMTLNVLNLFDQAASTRTYQMMLLGGTTSIKVPIAQYFQGYNVDAAIAASGSARDPRYLMVDRYQAPRSARIGLRIYF